MKIEFWSDIVCPYCGLMDHRLRLALDRFAYGDQVQVTHRSFQLHPDLPRAGVSQRKLIEMVGAPRSTVDRILRPIERAAEAEGLSPYRAIDRTLGPTDLAHELLAYAADQGRGNEIWAAEALRSRRYRAHVAADQTEAQRLGANGTPFLVLDDRVAIPGAVGTDDLLAVITKVWAESHPMPQPLPVVATADDLCTPDSCAAPSTT
ncbi:DsbA family protein [Planotetraspora thailandica]|uniref:DsbA family oxidoreductase n=1 Tax=Planotetraspora thailandica TaxID=487172 RepID=UPI0035E6BC66